MRSITAASIPASAGWSVWPCVIARPYCGSRRPCSSWRWSRFGRSSSSFSRSPTGRKCWSTCRLPQGASILATGKEVEKVEALLQGDADIVVFVSYVGSGSPRFYLPLDQQLDHDNFAQFVMLTQDLDARERVIGRLRGVFDGDFTGLRARINRLENGPPVGFPLQFRVSGRDIAQTRRIAEEVAEIMRANPHTLDVQMDWGEPSKVVHLEVDQDKARVMGISSKDVSFVLDTLLSGLAITQYREENELIDVVGRGQADERSDPGAGGRNRHTDPERQGGAAGQLVRTDYGFEEGIIWRRNRLPTLTVRADIRDDIQAPDGDRARSIRCWTRCARSCPRAIASNRAARWRRAPKAQASINAVMPLMLFGRR